MMTGSRASTAALTGIGTALCFCSLSTCSKSMGRSPAGTARAAQGSSRLGLPVPQFKEHEEPEKVEGDKRTPAGFFRIGRSFGFSPSRLPGYIKVKSGETVCVEDPSSPFYNTITKRSDIGIVNADDMGSNPLYRWGLFVEYPSDRAGRRGSCIFIHIWSASNIGTAGCIGLPEARIRALQEFAQAGAVLAVLPGSALDRFANCLPVATVRPTAWTRGYR